MKTELIAYHDGGFLFGGAYKIDLFEDEPIPLIFTADDFTNIDERSSTYSKSFEIPGTKTNNQFFGYIYDSKVDSIFDPHKKKKCIINQNTTTIFDGWLQVVDIVRKGKEISYEITIFSDEVNIKDKLLAKKFSDLDLSELTHDYTLNQIGYSWTTGLTYDNPANSYGFRDAPYPTVKYPFVKWDNEVEHESSYGYIIIPTSANQEPLWSHVFKPFINVDYLFRTIFADVGYRIQSAFMGTDDWRKLYVDFTNKSNGEDEAWWNIRSAWYGRDYGYTFQTYISTDALAPLVDANNTFDYEDFYNHSTEEIIIPVGINGVEVTVEIPKMIIYNPGISTTVSTAIKIYRAATGNTSYYTNSGTWCPHSPSEDQDEFTLFSAPESAPHILNTGDKISLSMYGSQAASSFKAIGKAEWNAAWIPVGGTFGEYSEVKWHVNRSTVDFSAALSGERGEVIQWDFIKSLKTMFNLVVTIHEDNPNILLIEPYDVWVDSGNKLDWSRKLDSEESRMTPMEDLSKELIFKSGADDDDYIRDQYSHTNHLKSWSYHFDSGDEIYDEEESEVEAELFASTHFDGLWGTALACPVIVHKDGEQMWDNKMRIMYDNGTTTNGSYGWFDTTYGHVQNYLRGVFSMCNTLPPVSATSLSLDFGVVNYKGTGGAVIHGLFNQYWSKYVGELYHKDTRIQKVKLLLTEMDIQSFKFNDIIHLEGQNFRVKSLEYNGESSSVVELLTIKDL